MSGDEWKGEGEEVTGFLSFFSKPMTEEERQKRTADCKAAAAIGDLVYPTLALYEPDRACEKCGCRRARVTFYARTGNLDDLRQVGNHEHLRVECRRCGYARLERPLDAPARGE